MVAVGALLPSYFFAVLVLLAVLMVNNQYSYYNHIIHITIARNPPSVMNHSHYQYIVINRYFTIKRLLSLVIINH